ncbi:MAG TPA: hypothetical protein VHU18_12855 [Rhizomicrobium sp.]|jgi:hypothetical protein|nr:hypothetical protein [Rhizomicrobium sp.]
MCWRLFIGAVAALLLAFSPAAAQGRIVHPYGPGAPVPLERILPQIRSAHPGTFSDVDGPFPDPAGRLHYRIKWLTPEGKVIWLDADARTGHVLGVNRGWGGYGHPAPYPRGYFAPFPRIEGPPPRYFRPGRGWGRGWMGGHFGLGGMRGGGHGHGGRGGRGR